MFSEPQSGGREAIHRILEAYGYTTRQALCAHLGVSQSTMANRYMRDTFPHDWVIACNLDTGASLKWLLTGKGIAFNSPQMNSEISQINHKKISNGVMRDDGSFIFDKKFLPENSNEFISITFERKNFIIDAFEGDITDGLWLVEIDNLVSVRELYRFPGGRIRIENGKASFECQAEDIKVLGKVRSKTEYFD